ncbi:MAG: dephospho-CoA kinase [Elusimicrobia bacterium]|nr:dephospho-CoA kinase [Elusimicrobiota bacterium]
MQRLVIGLTGGIATGKSTVVQVLRQRGATIIDADRIAREVVRPGHPVWRRLVRVFGRRFLSPGGTLNRQRLGQWVFQHPSQRRLLERITHPPIIRQIRSRLKNAHGVVVLDAPLLFEARLTPLVDKVVVVWTPQTVQHADVVLDNSGSRTALFRQVRRFWRDITTHEPLGPKSH